MHKHTLDPDTKHKENAKTVKKTLSNYKIRQIRFMSTGVMHFDSNSTIKVLEGTNAIMITKGNFSGLRPSTK